MKCMMCMNCMCWGRGAGGLTVRNEATHCPANLAANPVMQKFAANGTTDLYG